MGKKMKAFNTKRALCGDYRIPRQMLQEQIYDEHSSIHDDKMAADLGFSGAPIEDRLTSASFHCCCMKFLVRPGLNVVVSVCII